MRLHHLEITAFGPFADTVEIDFDELGADGLFLLHGQTGAGKTSILDAVAFALYGTVPGARSEGRRLLSDHARVGAVPTVRLEATIAGRRLAIERSPEFERPKKRGTGTIKQQAKANLTWLDGSGENLSRAQEIGDVVKSLLGMSAEQFFQVVLLPQGDFARFLRANSEERGRLLERLFDTTRFGDVEQWFRDRRGAGTKLLAEQQKKVEVLAAKVAASAGIEAGADADPVEWAGRLLAEAAESRDDAAAALARVRAVDEVNRRRLDETVALADRLRRRRDALNILAELEQTQTQRVAVTAERDAAHRAVSVAVVDREAARLAREADAAVARAETAAAPLRNDDEGRELLQAVGPMSSAADRDIIRPRCEEWSSEAARLDVLLDRRRRLTELENEREKFAGRRRALTDERRQVIDERAALPERSTAAADAVAEAERAAAMLLGLSTARDRAADALDAATELASRRNELERLEARVLQLHSEHNHARDAHLDVRQRRIDGMAAELAARLTDGEPCMVCGSTEHPEPARPAPDTATKADEERAHAAEQRAATALSEAREAVTELSGIVAVLRQRCGDAELAELTTAHAEAVRAHNEAATVAGRLDHLRATVEDLRKLDTVLAEQEKRLDAELSELAREDAVRAAEITEIRERIVEAVGDLDLLAPRRRTVAALSAAATALLDARTAALQARTAADERAADARTAAAEAGFTDLDSARAAVRTPERLAEIDRVLRAADDERAVATSTLNDPAIAALTGDEVADVTAARAAVDDGAAAVETALSAATEAERRHLDIENYSRRLERACAELVPLLDEHAELSALADVVAGMGSNAKKMSLRSYVLAARLEEVADAASERLRRMSGGRYEFVHSDAAESRGRRGGLGLDIHDEYTGAVRSTKTLSGGESFQASLALALGLADVVAAEGGGLVLDTMFIDEGFGSLDADALEAVMGVLDELRAGGRVVGVVSHVDEMRQRIPSRLHVIRGRSGSTVRVAS
ncbi:ATP-dependent dsDNA exonuclease [Rhodococcus pyridinivorans]|uniref:AAA family ATPase n=1 Tax=Rhodococcus pyridinivorans TaxID=103816 RepID=UPI00055C6A83|nr:SMC family ATPase [Rhodococcus pyridinivorans]AWZ26891.1 ATP-dependent dsDNA exonuclease [Rhodococcus pyridinivorans]